ncbi:MAG: SDR family oxidoreductase [Bacillota bacterium]|nr:SDR family oxidoreductase [Bacillota bacterium]
MVLNYEEINYERLLQGYRILITGGASGIGRETALLFAKHGATVAIADRDRAAGRRTEAELRDISPASFLVVADLGRLEEVDRVADLVIERFGSLHSLVNNVGVFEPGFLIEQPIEALGRMLDVNVTGTIRMTQRILPAMFENRNGTLVHILSDYCLRGAPGVSLFAATKGAIYSFSRAIAYEYSRYNIRSNCILPGMNIGSHGERYIEHYGETEAEEDFAQFQPLAGRGSTLDVANAALFLASELSRFVNGDQIDITGGAGAKAHKQYRRREEGNWKQFATFLTVPTTEKLQAGGLK